MIDTIIIIVVILAAIYIVYQIGWHRRNNQINKALYDEIQYYKKESQHYADLYLRKRKQYDNFLKQIGISISIITKERDESNEEVKELKAYIKVYIQEIAIFKDAIELLNATQESYIRKIDEANKKLQTYKNIYGELGGKGETIDLHI